MYTFQSVPVFHLPWFLDIFPIHLERNIRTGTIGFSGLDKSIAVLIARMGQCDDCGTSVTSVSNGR